MMRGLSAASMEAGRTVSEAVAVAWEAVGAEWVARPQGRPCWARRWAGSDGRKRDVG
jgi:hypothetical protein